jgi:hypothetical protein
MVGVVAGSSGCLDFVTVVGELLKMGAGVIPSLFGLWAHAPSLAGIWHEVVGVNEVVEAVALLCFSEGSAAESECFAGFFDLLNSRSEGATFPWNVHARGDEASFCVGKGAVCGLHVAEELADGAAAVEDDVLSHASPVDLVAAVEKHFSESGLDGAHEAVGFEVDVVLSDGFGNGGGRGAGNNVWIWCWLCRWVECDAVVENLVGVWRHG